MRIDYFYQQLNLRLELVEGQPSQIHLRYR